jgi:hypothetical protein
MSLTVTVQKGHDFSSGNITRATLNAGAVPTVAVTGSVSTTEIVNAAVTADKLATDSVENVKILDGAVTETKLGADAVTLAKLGPDSVVGANLFKTKDADADNASIIGGLAAFADGVDVAVDDYLMVHDTSVSVDGTVQLKRAKVSQVQKVGTTEYVLSDITGDLVAGSGTNYTLEIDMDGSPFQTLTLTADKDYNITITNQSSTAVKTMTVRVKAPATGTAPRFGDSASSDNWPTNWSWPERTLNIGPPNIPAAKVALLSITSFGATDADVVAAYAVTV